MAERKRILSLTIMNVHSWKIWKNSPHMLSFRCFALAWVIWPLLKSNTSSLSKKTRRNRTIYTYGSEAVRLYLLQLPQELEDRHVVLTETFVSLAWQSAQDNRTNHVNIFVDACSHTTYTQTHTHTCTRIMFSLERYTFSDCGRRKEIKKERERGMEGEEKEGR